MCVAGATAMMIAGTTLFAVEPKVLLYHSFDGDPEKADYSTAEVAIEVGAGSVTVDDAVMGKAVKFSDRATEAGVRINLGDVAPAEAWTIALWQIIETKGWLVAPENNLLTLLDAEGNPILKLSKSAGLFFYRDGKEIRFECFDALYWVQTSREHVTITWQPDGSGVNSPGGLLMAYFEARPYAAFAVDIDRTPATLVLGEDVAGTTVDELYVLDTALPLRGIWDLMRHKPEGIPALEKKLAERCGIEEARPAAQRLASWKESVRKGNMFEAEATAGESSVIDGPAQDEKIPDRLVGDSNPGTIASGNACVSPGKSNALTIPFEVKEAGKFSLALRYGLERRINEFWLQDTEMKKPWSENSATLSITLDGKPFGSGKEKLYPTGDYNGHTGDVTMFAWHALQSGKKADLAVGKHKLTVTFDSGLGTPIYDALLVSPGTGKTPPHPRWIDLYRIPPAWWVKSHKTKTQGDTRTDTYVVTLMNRCEEPCSYEIVADTEKAPGQTVSTSVGRIALAPLEEKEFTVTFTLPNKPGISGWANIYLWNEDVALRQKYRLWNITRAAGFAEKKHPVLIPVPNPEKQRAFREWLKTRDEQTLTPDLEKWRNGSEIRKISKGGMTLQPFSVGINGQHLEALDTWMSMSAAEIEQYLPDGIAEFHGYGTGWDRIGLEYSNLWYRKPKVISIEPVGDIDEVRKLTVEAPDWHDLEKKKKDPSIEPKLYRKVYERGPDNDVILSMRDDRWQSMLGFGISGGAPYKDTVLGRLSYTGIPLVAEAYHLTGDPAYAKKAYEMIMIFARKYTRITKHLRGKVHREDRDWWGSRVGNLYLAKSGGRKIQNLGTFTLDLIWEGLTPAEREMIEHNVQRVGVSDGMYGPLLERPEYFAGVNNEDLPHLELGKVLGDTAPLDGLGFFYGLFKGMILPDGIHQCSIGSYGGVGVHAERMKLMADRGLNIYDDPAVRNLFTAHPSFVFSGGGLPNIDDGGGVGLYGGGPGSGCASDELYDWAYQKFKDPTLKEWPKLIKAGMRVINGEPEKKAARMRAEYLDNPTVDVKALWPNIYIAPVKGMAMLRNWVPKEPVDWVEVIFDYGLMGGRSHGHAAKLATIPSFNGQIVSMEYGYGKLGELMELYTSSYAHNVVIADESSQAGSAGAIQIGTLIESFKSEELQWIDAHSSKIYPDIYMRRTVFTTPFGIVDLYLCRAEDDKDHQYDWVFHSFGEASTDGKMKRINKLHEHNVLRFAIDPRTRESSDSVQVTWKNQPITKPPAKSSTALLHENAYVRLWSAPEKATALVLYAIPMIQDVGNEIDYAILRRKAKHTVFATVQEPWRESTAPKVKSIGALSVKAGNKSVANSEAYALQVILVDGRQKVFFVNYSDTPKTIGRVTTDAGVAVWEVEDNGRIVNQNYTTDAAFTVQ